jgi:hypothetical protein
MKKKDEKNGAPLFQVVFTAFVFTLLLIAALLLALLLAKELGITTYLPVLTYLI